MKKLYIILILMAGALVSSCTKESPNPERESHRGISLKITPPATAVTTTRAAGNPEEGTEAENKIENLKIFILKDVGADLLIEKVYNFDPSADRHFTNGERWVAATWSLEVNESTDPDVAFCAIFVAANWHPTNSKDFEVGDSYSNIESAYTVNTDEIESPFVMSNYIEFEPKNFISGAKFTINLERQPIKVEMTVKLDAAFAAAYPDFSFGELSGQKPTMGVVATPNMSRVFPMVPIDGTPGFKYVAIPSKDMTTAADGKSWTASFYLNENDNKQQSQSPFRRTILTVQLPHQKTGSADVVNENYYTIAIKTDKSVQPYCLYRNTIYRVTATLLGFGSTTPPDLSNNVSVAVEAAPWTDSGYDDVIGGAKLGVDKNSVDFQYFVGEHTVNITSNMADWKMVNKATGVAVLSATDLPTGKTVTIDGIAYELSGTTSVAMLKVKKATDGHQATRAQQFLFVAGNLKTSFTVNYDNGIIPTSVLTAAGWVNNRPAKGLQIAKIGNVLPSGKALAGESPLKWSTEYYTRDNTFPGLGTGKSNTDDIMNRSKVYPAAMKCREIGPEWYLPSIEELRLIFNQQNTFGSSYTTNRVMFFWSSTEPKGDTRYAMMKIFYDTGANTGIEAQQLKDNVYFVRCVRNI